MKPSDNRTNSPYTEIQYQANGQLVLNTTTGVQGWRKIITCGALIKGNFKDANPWSYTVTTKSGLRGQIERKVLSTPGNRTQLLYYGQLDFEQQPAELNTVADEARCYDRAVERLNEKVRGGLDLATSLAETGQTIKMLNLVSRFKAGVADMARSYNREIARKIRNFKTRKSLMRDLKRWQRGLERRFPGAYRPVPVNPGLTSRVTSLAANGWCEFTYGWSPLIGDIRRVAENIVGHVRNADQVNVSYTQRIDSMQSVLIDSKGISVPAEIKTTGFIKVRFGIKLAPGWDEGLAKWTSLNPASVAWELVPYSFVVDWFFDLGSYLRGLETAFLYGNTFQLGSFRSTLVKYDRHLSSVGGKKVGIETQTWAFNSSLSKSQFSRSLLISYPAPHIPSFQVDLGSNRLLSAAALLRQLLRR